MLGEPKDGCVGNPCDPSIGNKFAGENDYVGIGSFPLTFARFYNSRSATLGGLWTHTFDRYIVSSGANSVAALRPDGKTFIFTFTDPSWIPDGDVTDKLEPLANGWKLTASDGDVVEVYGTNGRLTSLSNRAGLTQTLSYFNAPPNQGKLQQVTDSFGRTLTFAYNAANLLVSMTDPAGGVYQFAYDSASRLSQVIYPGVASPTRAYVYNDGAWPDALEGIVDENGTRFATWAYDTTNHVVTSSEHAGGAGKVTLSYGANSTQVTSFVNSTLSATRTYAYQSILGVNRNTQITGDPCPQCGPASRTFDANGNYASLTDWNGRITNYAYDLTRNLETSRTEAFGTPQARTITTQWHPTFRLATKVAEPLRITSYVYNGDGGASCGFQADGVTLVPGVLCSKTIQPTSDTTGTAGFGATPAGTPRTWTYTYNANGSILAIDGPRTDLSDITTYTYYSNTDGDLGKRGNVATITNALGHVTSITAYNAHGQPTTIVDPNGLTTTLTYDARKRLTSKNVGGELTSYSYDAVGQFTQVTLPDGSFLSYSYDAAHRLTSMSDNLGNRIAYTLDAMGNRTKEEVFDPANTLAQTRSRVFNNLNRLAQDLGAQNQTTTYGYDNQGNLTSIDGPLAGAVDVTTNAYDALNRLIRVTDPNQGRTQYTYDSIDQLVSVTDPRSLATTYNYDGLANLNSLQSPDTGTTTNTYDTAGNLLTQTDAKGQITSYAYDALNRVVSITFQGGSKQTYAYDQGVNGIGRLSSITETNPQNQVTSILAYAYDQRGRTISETRTINGVAYVLAYGYDTAGRLSGLTYPSGRTIAYALDALGRVNQVSTTPVGGAQQIVASNVAYQPFGGVKSYTLGNGRTYVRSYDLDGRIASYNLGAQSFALGYDAASRISFITDTANAANTNTYSYDNLDRLTGAVLPNLPFAYAYDAVGNRSSKMVGSATDTYAYGAASNRLESITAQTGAVRNFAFDPNGSTTADGNNLYGYDTRGRIVQSVGALGTTAYQVNALGQRIRKTNTTEDRVFLYDTRGRLIAETDPGGGLKREYLYLNDIPLVVFQ